MVATVPAGNDPVALAYDSANGDLYVVNVVSHNVTVVNGGTDMIVGSIPVGAWPNDVAYDPTNADLYVANEDSANVTVISGATDTVVGSVPFGGDPTSDAIDPANDYLYVGNQDYRNLTVFDVSTETFAGPISVGSGPDVLLYDAGNARLYAANSGSNNVTVINAATDLVLASVPVGSSPLGLAVDPTTGVVYVSNEYSDNLTVINASTDTVVGSIPVGTNPEGLAFDGADGLLYVANIGSANVTEINASTGAVVGSISVGSDPVSVAYDPANQYVYVTNQGSDNLSVINGRQPYVVSFEESGLPTGTDWWVNVSAGGAFPVVGSALNVTATNGSYAYSVGSANGSWAALGGSFTVEGAALQISILFSLQTFSTTFTEVGLTARQLEAPGWTVTLGGVSVTSHAMTAVVSGLANGSYLVLVQGPSGEENSESALHYQTVHGATAVALTFSKGRTATLTFAERGLASGSPWCVSLQSDRLCSALSTIGYGGIDTQHPGNFYAIESPTAGQTISVTEGKQTLPARGNVSVSKNTRLLVSFAYPYTVTFSQTGLPAGAWSVTVQGYRQVAPWDSSIDFELTNGTHAYRIGVEQGYASSGSPKRLKVVGAPTSVEVTFQPKKRSAGPLFLNMSTPLEYSPSPGEYYATLSLTPTPGLVTGEFGLTLETAVGAAVSPGSAPASCAVGVSLDAVDCDSPATGWYAVLYYLANETISNVFSGATWAGPSVEVTGAMGLAVVSGTSYAGSGDTLEVYGTGANFVGGSSGPF